MSGDPTERRVRIVLAALLLFAAGVRGVHLGRHLASPLGLTEEVLVSTDLQAFAEWGRRIAGGDVLGRDTYHPYMDWMERIAPLDRFERWWGGREIFHQAPLYPYLVGASYAVAGSTVPLLVLQALAGTLAAYFAFLLGRAVRDDLAGLVAAALTALFAPAVVLDALLLRATWITLLTLGSLVAVLAMIHRPSRSTSLTAGIVLGLNVLLKPTGLPLVVLAVGIAAWATPRSEWKRWVPGLAAGLLLCAAPLVARNLAVGAPATALSTRGPETILQSNGPYSDPGFMSYPPESRYGELLERSGGRVTGALAAAWSEWPERRMPWGWIGLTASKAIATLLDFEHPNNVNFYFVRQAHSWLRFLPTLGWFVGAAVVGIGLAVRHARDRAAAALVAAGMLSILAGLLASFVSGRYRCSFAVLLTIPTGLAVSVAWTKLRDGRRGLVAGMAGVAAIVSMASFEVAAPRAAGSGDGLGWMSNHDSGIVQEAAALRPLEPIATARVLATRGERDRARSGLLDYAASWRALVLRRGPGAGGPGRYVLRSRGVRALGETATALEQLGFPDDAATLREQGRALLGPPRRDPRGTMRP